MNNITTKKHYNNHIICSITSFNTIFRGKIKCKLFKISFSYIQDDQKISCPLQSVLECILIGPNEFKFEQWIVQVIHLIFFEEKYT